MLLPSLLDKVVVVTDADVLPLYVGKFLAGSLRREGFEITLPRRTWCKQNQHRCGLVGLILEAMHSTFRDKQKISCDRVDPAFAVEQLHHAGDNEKRFGHGSVEVRAGPRRVRFRIPPIQAEFSPCRCSGRQIAHSSPRADRQLGFLAHRTVERADLTCVTLVAGIGIRHLWPSFFMRGRSKPQRWNAAGCWRFCRMTESTRSPHCTHRYTTRSTPDSLTMRPPQRTHRGATVASIARLSDNPDTITHSSH